MPEPKSIIIPALLALLMPLHISGEEKPTSELGSYDRCYNIHRMLLLIENLKKKGGEAQYMENLQKNEDEHRDAFVESKCWRFKVEVDPRKVSFSDGSPVKPK